MDDSGIISLFHARSEQAIEELDRVYGATVRKVVLNILNSTRDAEECVNDTYLAVWNTVPPERPSPLLSYVCRIARNLAVKKYHANTARKRDSRYDLALDELAECLPSPRDVEGELTAKELSAAIDRFLDTLCYEDRFCFLRRYWYADSVADIAAMTGFDRHRISVRLFRTREKLHRALKEEGLLE